MFVCVGVGVCGVCVWGGGRLFASSGDVLPGCHAEVTRACSPTGVLRCHESLTPNNKAGGGGASNSGVTCVGLSYMVRALEAYVA